MLAMVFEDNLAQIRKASDFFGMVEHAGSEKMALGQKPLVERTYESKYINRSLAQLNDVCLCSICLLIIYSIINKFAHQ